MSSFILILTTQGQLNHVYNNFVKALIPTDWGWLHEPTKSCIMGKNNTIFVGDILPSSPE